MTTAPPERSRTHRITGITVSVILALLTLTFAFSIYVQFFAFLDPTTGLPTACSAAKTVGTHCSQSFLSTIVLVGYAVCLFGWGLPVGFMVVRLIQKRRAWFWPLISLPVIYAGYFILTAVLGTQYLPVSGS
jgi:purine-cytosine permease-like protein